MVSGIENFRLSGPIYLNDIDWNNAHHRRSVAASLVQGVYLLEEDRQANRRGSQSLALPWWEFFHFKLLRRLIDDADYCIFGAIFEYNPPPFIANSTVRSPRYVIAFRGTLIKLDTFVRDIALDVHIIRNGLHQTTRFAITMIAVRDIAASVGDSKDIWLTGHSLGAAMAMLAGKTLAKTGKFVEAFLFNPPFLSPPIEKIKNKKVRHGIRFAGTLITAGLAIASATKDRKNNSKSRIGDEDKLFDLISGWIPCLFVNRADNICSEYIGYFEHKQWMEKIGVGEIARFSSQHSLGNLVMTMAGVKGVEIEEPLHLLPSANLAVNLNPSQDFLKAHELCQWWRPEINLKYSVYKYTTGA